MTWLLWRQHRRQGAVTLGVLGALAVLLWITGLSMAHTYRTALSVCRANDTCGELNLFQGDGAIIDLVNATVLIPVLIGVFWGATIVGRELDTGTNRLVWTQSVTRRAWMRSKVLLLLASSAAVGALVAALVTWWSGTPNAYHQNRFQGLQFDTQGVMPIAYALFAAALGLAAGVLWRRTLPAIATTAAGFFAVRLLVEVYLRPHFRAPVTVSVPLGTDQGGPPGAWVLSSYPTLNGHPFSGALKISADCSGSTNRQDTFSCLARLGYRDVTTYQPAGRYWSFQLTEAAIFLVLAVILTSVAVIALKRQDA
jgi:hypothetical protein